MTAISTFVSIKSDINAENVECQVATDDILVFRYPDKMYISFKAIDTSPKFYLTTYFSQTLLSDKYVNEAACTDQGAHLKLNAGNNSQ